MTEPTGCDDGALMQITDDQIDWIVEKAAIARDTGRLALLSVLMGVRDLARVSLQTTCALCGGNLAYYKCAKCGKELIQPHPVVRAEGAALVSAVQHLEKALRDLDDTHCGTHYDDCLVDVAHVAREVVARLAGEKA